MFSIKEKISAFQHLSYYILSDQNTPWLDSLAYKAQNGNQWFTSGNTLYAFKNIANNMLSVSALKAIENSYTFNNNNKALKVGLILAGNIPLVGFHDILCILLTQHIAYIKCSSQDEVLIKGIITKLLEIEPRFTNQVQWADKLTDIEAVIATGSDNTAKHFEFYFKHVPKIIRKNRTSVAIITGNETEEEINKLGQDISTYYGLGCRNVSKLLVLGTFKPEKFYPGMEQYEYLMDNHKYKHNYDYNKSIYLLNRDDHYDNGFLLTRPSELLVSPISVVYYQEFGSMAQIEEYISVNSEKIQCVVSSSNSGDSQVVFGQAQNPGIMDYPDGVDVLNFLLALN
jgi:hypothetical protein